MDTFKEISSNTAYSTAHFWKIALSKGLPTAIWRLPKSSIKHLVVDLSGQLSTQKVDLEELSPGFAFSPFLNAEGDLTTFINADLHFCFDVENQLIEEEVGLDKRIIIEDFLDESGEIVSREKEIPSAIEAFADTSLNEMEHYMVIVEQAIEAIQQGKMQKVVLSRTKQISLPPHFELMKAFDQLCVAYPNAFVSAVWLPEQGVVWLGATPETLVSVDKNGIFRTASLAGTQSVYNEQGLTMHPSEARWTQKEIEEQALVCRYIIECFKKIRLREYIENGPKTVVAGNLMHLRTDYSVDMQAVNFPQLGTVMLNLLHPTSAVCGMPKPPALHFILSHETAPREFYSGFLGPVNIEDESHLFVNLRTMKIADRQATLYAGAGITEDSIPEKEWKETEMKCDTLLSVINRS